MAFFRRSNRVEAASPTVATSTAATSASLAGIMSGGRARAMAIPTISRGRDLLASLIASCPIEQYGTQWDGERLVEIPLPPEPWQSSPDPRTTRSHILAWTFDDLLFHGRAYWLVTRRYAAAGPGGRRFPAEFTRLPAVDVNLQASVFAGNVPVGAYTIDYLGTRIAVDDVIVFYSPLSPLLEVGARAILTAERLDLAALRFATTPTAFGWLKVTGGEPLSEDEMRDLAAEWALSRDENSVAALSEHVTWQESGMDPSKLQLVEARQHSALECSRLVNVSPGLVGAPTGGSLTYSTVEMARAQLGQDALPFLDCIEQTLSSDLVTPRGRRIRLDRSAWQVNPLEGSPTTPATEEVPV